MKKIINKNFVKKISLLSTFGLSLFSFIACSTVDVQKEPDKAKTGDNDEPIAGGLDVLPDPDRSGTGPGSINSQFPNDGKFENTTQVSGYPVSALAYETRNSNYIPGSLDRPRVNSSTKKFITGEIPNSQYEFINDYTFGFAISSKRRKKDGSFVSPSEQGLTTGTGWVLDFIEPADGKYPTTWFIATNAHVVSEMKFPNNTYKDVELSSEEAYGEFDGFALDYAIKKADNKVEMKRTPKWTTKDKTPEMFYLAYNFLGKQSPALVGMDFNGIQKENFNKYEDYFKDFAVIKITFSSEAEAKEVTRDFATKYKNKKTVFAKQSLMTKSSNELAAKNDIYMLGYPTTSRMPTINKEEGDTDFSFASELSIRDNKQIGNKFGQKIHGMANVSNYPPLDLLYNRSKKLLMQRIGLIYTIEDSSLGGGSSGTMVVNKNNEVLAIMHSNEYETRTSVADPLISEGFTVDGKIVFPAYDLIYGGKTNQVNSFQDSMKKHFKGQKSWLLGQL